MFGKLNTEGETFTVLTGVDKESGWGSALLVDKAALATDQVALRWFFRLLAELGCEGQSVVVHIDADATLQAFVARAAARHLGRMVLRRSPHKDHQSSGKVEQWSQELAGNIRALRLMMEADTGLQIGEGSDSRVLLGWCGMRRGCTNSVSGPTGGHRPMLFCGAVPFRGELAHCSPRSW